MFIVVLSILTIASFVYAIIAHQSDQVTAYYNSFARAWELLLGVLVGRADSLHQLADVGADAGGHVSACWRSCPAVP